jgi:hypothetical protein
VAATISQQGAAAKRGRRRRRGTTIWIGLLALLFVFWRFIGGPGGFLPGDGARPGDDGAPSKTPASLHESTARPIVAAQMRTRPPARRPEPVTAALVDAARSGNAGTPARAVGGVDAAPGAGGDPKPPDPAPGTTPDEVAGQPVPTGGAAVEGGGAVDAPASRAGGVPPAIAPALATVRGVASFATGEPAAGVDFVAMAFRGTEASPPVEFRTRDDGTFAFETQAGHDVLVELRPLGSPAGADVDARVFRRDALEPGASWDLEGVTFERQVLVAEGVVADHAGTPQPNATIVVLPIALPIRALTARSDSAGRFEVKGPAGAGLVEVFALTEDGAARAVEPVPCGAAGIALVLEPAGAIRGRVAAPAPAVNPLIRIELRTEAGNLYATTTALSDGTFEFPHVPAGRYAIATEAPDRGVEVLAGIAVPAGALAGDARLDAVPVRSGLARARVRVVDASGAPVGGAAVAIALGPSATLRGRTASDGALDAAAPADGSPVRIAVTHAAFTPHRATWDGKRVITLTASSSRPSR